eukprot:GSChrysophyteH1.ASY1.ANO1.1794.1 assembled CDS
MLIYLSLLVLIWSRNIEGEFVSQTPNALHSDELTPLFLIDPDDGLCIAGARYKRCSFKTQWFLSGKQSAYKIHHRPADDEDDQYACLEKTRCGQAKSAAALGSCDSCGAQKWEFVKDSSSKRGSYVVTQGTSGCLKRIDNEVHVVPCDTEGFTHVQVQMLDEGHLKALTSDGARLVAAAADGSSGEVRRMIQRWKVSPNERDFNEATPLIVAAGIGDLELASYLLAEGADVHAADKDGVNALHEAALAGGDAKVPELLVYRGIDINAATSSGITALWLAAAKNNVALVKLLLTKGANPNAGREDDLTPLMVAAAGGAAEVVRLLVRSRADVNAEDTNGNTAITAAAEVGNKIIVQELLRYGANPAPPNARQYSPLAIAASRGDLDVVRLLMEANAPMTDSSEFGMSPLMYAAAAGQAEVTSFLLEQQARVDGKDLQGRTALIHAATHGDKSVVDLLLSRGANVDVADVEGYTALMAAAAEGHTHVCRLLVEAGAAVDAVTTGGDTALIFASHSGHIAALQVLVERGADVGKTDENGVTPLIHAVKRGHAEAARFLVTNGANPNDNFLDENSLVRSLLMDAVHVNNTEWLSLLLEKGGDVDYKSPADGTTLITQAAMQGNLPLTQILLSAGAKAHLQNSSGVNALLACTTKNQPAICAHLLAVDTSYIDDADRDGTTALMIASALGNHVMVQLLLDAGASVDVRNSEGHSALMFAYNGQHKLQKILEERKQQGKDTQALEAVIQKASLIVQVLIDAGADTDLRDKNDKKAGDFEFKPMSILDDAASTQDVSNEPDL